MEATREIGNITEKLKPGKNSRDMQKIQDKCEDVL
jgi:hypothetical protein